jgi:hypothetical protein
MNDYFPQDDVLTEKEVFNKNFLLRRLADIQEYKNKIREREKINHFQKFQTLLDNHEKYLFFVHNFLPYKDFPIGGVYYELLVLFESSSKSYCSLFYDHDMPQNRLDAQKKFYEILNIMFDIKYTKQELWELQEKERKYTEAYGKFISVVCHRIFNIKKITTSIKILGSVEKQWMELIIYKSNKPALTYYSNTYERGIFDDKKEFYKVRSYLYAMFLKNVV